MAFKNKIYETKMILLLLTFFWFSLVAATNIDCSGKSFHCVNSTHFMICVDLGGGKSETVENYVVKCPSSTVCLDKNRFECEFPVASTEAISQTSHVTHEVQTVATTLQWEEINIDTIFPQNKTNETENSDLKILSTESLLPSSATQSVANKDKPSKNGHLNTPDIVTTDNSKLNQTSAIDYMYNETTNIPSQNATDTKVSDLNLFNFSSTMTGPIVDDILSQTTVATVESFSGTDTYFPINVETVNITESTRYFETTEPSVTEIAINKTLPDITINPTEATNEAISQMSDVTNEVQTVATTLQWKENNIDTIFPPNKTTETENSDLKILSTESLLPSSATESISNKEKPSKIIKNGHFNSSNLVTNDYSKLNQTSAKNYMYNDTTNIPSQVATDTKVSDLNLFNFSSTMTGPIVDDILSQTTAATVESFSGTNTYFPIYAETVNITESTRYFETTEPSVREIALNKTLPDITINPTDATNEAISQTSHVTNEVQTVGTTLQWEEINIDTIFPPNKTTETENSDLKILSTKSLLPSSATESVANNDKPSNIIKNGHFNTPDLVKTDHSKLNQTSAIDYSYNETTNIPSQVATDTEVSKLNLFNFSSTTTGPIVDDILLQTTAATVESFVGTDTYFPVYADTLNMTESTRYFETTEPSVKKIAVNKTLPDITINPTTATNEPPLMNLSETNESKINNSSTVNTWESSNETIMTDKLLLTTETKGNKSVFYTKEETAAYSPKDVHLPESAAHLVDNAATNLINSTDQPTSSPDFIADISTYATTMVTTIFGIKENETENNVVGTTENIIRTPRKKTATEQEASRAIREEIPNEVQITTTNTDYTQVFVTEEFINVQSEKPENISVRIEEINNKANTDKTLQPILTTTTEIIITNTENILDKSLVITSTNTFNEPTSTNLTTIAPVTMENILKNNSVTNNLDIVKRNESTNSSSFATLYIETTTGGFRLDSAPTEMPTTSHINATLTVLDKTLINKTYISNEHENFSSTSENSNLFVTEKNIASLNNSITKDPSINLNSTENSVKTSTDANARLNENKKTSLTFGTNVLDITTAITIDITKNANSSSLNEDAKYIEDYGLNNNTKAFTPKNNLSNRTKNSTTTKNPYYISTTLNTPTTQKNEKNPLGNLKLNNSALADKSEIITAQNENFTVTLPRHKLQINTSYAAENNLWKNIAETDVVPSTDINFITHIKEANVTWNLTEVSTFRNALNINKDMPKLQTKTFIMTKTTAENNTFIANNKEENNTLFTSEPNTQIFSTDQEKTEAKISTENTIFSVTNEKPFGQTKDDWHEKATEININKNVSSFASNAPNNQEMTDRPVSNAAKSLDTSTQYSLIETTSSFLPYSRDKQLTEMNSQTKQVLAVDVSEVSYKQTSKYSTDTTVTVSVEPELTSSKLDTSEHILDYGLSNINEQNMENKDDQNHTTLTNILVQTTETIGSVTPFVLPSTENVIILKKGETFGTIEYSIFPTGNSSSSNLTQTLDSEILQITSSTQASKNTDETSTSTITQSKDSSIKNKQQAFLEPSIFESNKNTATLHKTQATEASVNKTNIKVTDSGAVENSGKIESYLSEDAKENKKFLIEMKNSTKKVEKEYQEEGTTNSQKESYLQPFTDFYIPSSTTNSQSLLKSTLDDSLSSSWKINTPPLHFDKGFTNKPIIQLDFNKPQTMTHNNKDAKSEYFITDHNTLQIQDTNKADNNSYQQQLSETKIEIQPLKKSHEDDKPLSTVITNSSIIINNIQNIQTDTRNSLVVKEEGLNKESETSSNNINVSQLQTGTEKHEGIAKFATTIKTINVSYNNTVSSQKTLKNTNNSSQVDITHVKKPIESKEAKIHYQEPRNQDNMTVFNFNNQKGTATNNNVNKKFKANSYIETNVTPQTMQYNTLINTEVNLLFKNSKTDSEVLLPNANKADSEFTSSTDQSSNVTSTTNANKIEAITSIAYENGTSHTEPVRIPSVPITISTITPRLDENVPVTHPTSQVITSHTLGLPGITTTPRIPSHSSDQYTSSGTEPVTLPSIKTTVKPTTPFNEFVVATPMDQYVSTNVDTVKTPTATTINPMIHTEKQNQQQLTTSNVKSENMLEHYQTKKSNESEFDCSSRQRGRYADDHDCRKFYVCSAINIRDKTTLVVGYCPVNTVFSNIQKQCTKNLSHCIRNNQFKCTVAGRFSDYLKDNIYYICVKNSHEAYVRFKFQCQNGYYLNKTSVKCVQNIERSTQSVSFTKFSDKLEVSIDATNVSMPEKKSGADIKKEKREKEDFNCEEEGKFADPNDCRIYYKCTANTNSGFYRKKRICDSDEVFHKEKKECVDAESFEC